ncbi:Helix-turn-helix domain protein [compost metagenome]
MGFCQQLIASLPDESSLIESVRLACLSRTGHFLGAEAVAATLDMSARTLHRRLAEHQRTYQSVLDEVRCALAIEFLQWSDMPMEDLAVRSVFLKRPTFARRSRNGPARLPGIIERPCAAASERAEAPVKDVMWLCSVHIGSGFQKHAARRRFTQEQRNDQAQHRSTQGQVKRVFDTMVLGNVTR